MVSDSYCREALPSRVMILNQVMDALKGSYLYMIGVYGMGGIGKTTLAKEVYRKAVEEELFYYVVMVTVSQIPDLRRIQGEIAGFLGLEFDVNEVPAVRASQLYERLKYSKVLIILDDIWSELDLKSIGIPFGVEFNRSKILLTSRRKDVLCFEMGTQKDFSLEILHEDEARSLFEMTMGEAKHPELQAIGNEVVERCAGLPLLVIIVATYLKNRELSAWRDTLTMLFGLRNVELYRKSQKVINSIYQNLPSNEVKSFFLLCALFGGPNIPVNHLLTYAMGMGLFGNIIRLQDARERLFQIIEKLKIESLLLEGDMNGYVKMHDVVLDVARSIATIEQHAFYGISGEGLREWPSKDCTSIALPYCDINEIPQGLECPNTKLFSLFSKEPYLGIPDLFFKGFRELKVLKLTDMHFMSLPTSLHFLTNLHSLHLDRCQLDDVAIIGELKQLEFLSFAESYIVELPKQIEQLSQLKLLDLTNCTQLKVFPVNVLSKLSLLEELYMGNSFVKWDVKGNVSVMELEELCHLTTLEIQMIDDNKMPNGLFFRGLQRYIIFIGDEWAWDGTCEVSKSLKLRSKTVVHKKDGLKELLRGTQALYLDDVRGIKNLLYDIDGERCRQLKHLHIRNDDVIRHIMISSTMWASSCALPMLETLALDNLESLEMICCGQLESFSQLRILKISKCHALRDLFSPQVEIIFSKMVILSNLTSLIMRECRSLTYIFRSSTVKSLLQLKRLVIECCDLVEEIILTEESINEIVFPNLDFLRIVDLPNLKKFNNGYPIEFQTLKRMEIKNCHELRNIVSNISNKGENCDIQSSLFTDMTMKVSNMENLEYIWHTSQLTVDSFCKLKSLTIQSCMNLLAMFSSNVVRRFQRLEDLRIFYCPEIKEIYELGELNSNEVTAFELRHLKIDSMPSLKRIWSSEDGDGLFSFQNLKSVEANDCEVMEYIFPASMACDLLLLEKLDIWNCWGVEHIVGKGKSIESDDKAPQNFNFPELTFLRLQSLKKLRSFCPTTSIYEWPKLKYLEVCGCHKPMKFDLKVLQNAYKWYVIEEPFCSKSIFANQLQFLNNLRKINVRDCDSVQVVFDLEDIFIGPWHACLLPQLKDLQLINLPNLSELWNKDPMRMFDFKNLRLLRVQNCNSLKYAFTQSMALSLIKLQAIEIENCMMMEAIIKEEEAVETKLPKMTLTSVQKISIKGCPSMKGFMSRVLSREQSQRSNEELKEQIIGMQEHSEVLMPGLLELRIDWDIIKHKLDGNNQPDFFTRLKVVELVFPYNSFPTMEKLVLRDSLVEHIIIQGLDNNHKSLPRLRKIILFNLPYLEHLVYDNSSVFLNLQVLQVWKCNNLKTLVPSFVYFQNLTFLQVSTCDGLINLITASIATSLMQLKIMYVGRCKMMQQIVAAESYEEEDEIGFCQLQYLVLDDLPCLTSFCSSKNTFNFPYLKEVFVIRCPNMKMFAPVVNMPNLTQVQTGGKEYEWEWEGNLNNTIQALFMKRNAEATNA